MHYLAATVSLAAALLYADRSGWLFVHGTQTPWALLTRVGVGLGLVTVGVAFFDLATQGAPFEWRHWPVLIAMSLTVFGHLGLRRHPQSPT